MAPCPPCSLDELLPRGRERAEIPLVLAEPLIHERVELEVDLVQPRREVDRETGGQLPRADAPQEPLGQAKIHQAGRTGIEPIVRKTEVACDSIADVGEARGERIGFDQRLALTQRDYVNVLRRPFNQLQCKQRRATDDDKLVVLAASSEVLRKSDKQLPNPAGFLMSIISSRDVSHHGRAPAPTSSRCVIVRQPLFNHLCRSSARPSLAAGWLLREGSRASRGSLVTSRSSSAPLMTASQRRSSSSRLVLVPVHDVAVLADTRRRAQARREVKRTTKGRTKVGNAAEMRRQPTPPAAWRSAAPTAWTPDQT